MHPNPNADDSLSIVGKTVFSILSTPLIFIWKVAFGKTESDYRKAVNKNQYVRNNYQILIFYSLLHELHLDRIHMFTKGNPECHTGL